MFNGLGRYKLSGRQIVAAREMAQSKPSGHVIKGREIASRYGGSREQAAANTTTSAMSLGSLTPDDISLNYIGGSSSQQTGNSGSQSNIPVEVYKYYDAIYREDSICGAAIELRAMIPYGDFRLHGVSKARLQKYEEAVDNMRLRTMMPRIAIERDVQGAFLGMLDWNSDNSTYDSMLAYSRQHIANIIYPLVWGMDPVVDISVNAFLNDILKSNDPRLEDIKKCIPAFLRNAQVGNKGVPIPMDSVVWIDRPHTDQRFNSMLHRILPVFLIERALTRGTIEAAHRRQRGILHITAGNGDNWLATAEDMSTVAALFNDADADPLGAIVVTREGISPNEVRNPTDFWRITDSYEQTVPFKLRALGISESFLSGDATFNNAEVSISTFLQSTKAERSQVCSQLMYRKIFAQIAKANNYMMAGMGRERGEAQPDLFAEWEEIAANAANSLGNISQYDIPEVTWKQSLMPEGDQAYIELLNLLKEQGVPPPIRTLFAAGGLDFDSVMANSKGDIADRTQLTAYLEKIKEASPAPEPAPGEEGGDEFARFGATREVGIFNRKYEDGELYEPYTEISGGRKTWGMTTEGKRVIRDKQMRAHAEALARVADENNRRIRQNGEFE